MLETIYPLAFSPDMLLPGSDLFFQRAKRVTVSGSISSRICSDERLVGP
jgi:hypothetical protein